MLPVETKIIFEFDKMKPELKSNKTLRDFSIFTPIPAKELQRCASIKLGDHKVVAKRRSAS